MADFPLAVIDDEQAIRQLVVRIFAAREHVYGYESAEDFFDRFDASRPHLLIVDKNMPGLTGLELVARHRLQSPSAFEAVLITGYADTESALKAMKLGIYSYVRKPFQAEELVCALGGAKDRLRLLLKLKETEARLHEEEHRLGEAMSGFAEDLRVARQREVHDVMTERLGTLGQVAASVAGELERSFLRTEEQLLQQLVPSLDAASEVVRGGDPPGASSSAEDLALAAVQQHLEHMQQLADDLRVLTADETSVVDLRTVGRAAMRMVSGAVQRPEQIVVALPDQPVNIYGSQQHLAQAVINLLLNAAEAIDGDPDGSIAIRITADPPAGIVSVEDNGCGVGQERLGTIFEPFVGNKREGRGIGLTIVESIITSHHGTIEVDSREGAGTLVTLRMPLARRSGTMPLNTVVRPDGSDDDDGAAAGS